MVELVEEDTFEGKCVGEPPSGRGVREQFGRKLPLKPGAQGLYLSSAGQLPRLWVGGTITPPQAHASVLLSTPNLALGFEEWFPSFPSHFILHLFFCIFSYHRMYHTTPRCHSFPPYWIDSQDLREAGPGLIFNGHVPI